MAVDLEKDPISSKAKYPVVKKSRTGNQHKKGFFYGFIDYLKNPQFWITFIFVLILAPIIVEWVKFQLPRWYLTNDIHLTQTAVENELIISESTEQFFPATPTTAGNSLQQVDVPEWWIRDCINENDWNAYPNSEYPIFHLNLENGHELDCMNLSTLRFFNETNGNASHQSLHIRADYGTSWIYHDLRGESVALNIQINAIDFNDNSSQFINADIFLGVGSPQPSSSQYDGDFIIIRRLKNSNHLQICYSRNQSCDEVLFDEGNYPGNFENVLIQIIPSVSGGEINVGVDTIGSLSRAIHYESGDTLIIGYAFTNIDIQNNRYLGSGFIDAWIDFTDVVID